MSPTGKIRLALVVRPAAGGMRRHVSTLLAHLNREQFAPVLFAPPEFKPDILSSDVSHVPLAIGARTELWADWRAIRALAHDLHENFDIVHAHGLRGALIGVLAARRAGVASVFTAHNLVPGGSFFMRRMLASVGRRAARILAVSRAVADTLRAGGVPGTKISVIPNGIDLAPFDTPLDPRAVRAQFGLPADAPLIAAAGRFSREKGLPLLVMAVSHLQERLPGVCLALAGEGPDEPALRAQAKARNAPVVFVGQLPYVAPLFRAADVICVPSVQEGQGIVALEAMAAGKPVVASRVGGLAETVLEGETGLLVPPEDATALAGALAELLTDRKRRAAMGRAGRARVAREYSAVQMAGRIEAVYRDVLSL
jgi:glycosyltransferase involved in cell wall biosynthesis